MHFRFVKISNNYNSYKTFCLTYGIISFFLNFVIFTANASVLQDKDTTLLNKKRLIPVIATETVLTTTSLILLNNLWYKDYPRSGFLFFNDNNEWLLMDKFGHTTTSYRIAGTGYYLLKWSGVKENKAIWYGTATGFAYLTAIEVLDGFSKEWGFSPGDEIANIIGPSLFIGQQFLWNDQRLKLKWSFHQTGFSKYRPDLLGKNLAENVLKDYNGQTYWLSVNINSFLSQDSEFPAWLNIALGYGADGMLGARTNPTIYQGNILPTYKRGRQLYVSADIDLSKIKTKSAFLKTILNVLGFLKIPMPALEYNFSNNMFKGYYLYF